MMSKESGEPVGRRAGLAPGVGLLLLVLTSGPVGATELLDGRIKVDGFIMQGFQSLEADSGAFDADNSNTSPGFQRLRFNLALTFDIADNITGFLDLGEEPNDFGDGGDFQVSQDLGFVDIGLIGSIDDATDGDFFDDAFVEDNEVLLRIGNIVTTVFEVRGYSDGADVQSNPLIGNSPADMVTAESGAQLRGSHQLDLAPIEFVNWDFGVTVPTFGEAFGPNRGFNFFGRVSAETSIGLDVGFGWFYNDLGGQVGEVDFDDVQTSEMLFGDGENYNFPGSSTNSRDTHSGLLPGLNATVFQANLQYTPSFWPATLRGWLGYAKDDFSFVDADGNQTVRTQAVDFADRNSEEFYFGVEGTAYAIPDKLYGAVRYTYVSNESSNVGGGGKVLDRLQVGGGWWFAENSLLKFEYVRQNEDRNSPGQIGADWDGFLVEASFRF